MRSGRFHPPKVEHSAYLLFRKDWYHHASGKGQDDQYVRDSVAGAWIDLPEKERFHWTIHLD